MTILYNRMLDDVVEHLRGTLLDANKKNVKCERYIGSFSEKDVAAFANRSPQVLVSVGGIEPVEHSETHRLIFSAAPMTRGTSRNRNGEEMLNLLNILVYGIAQMDMDWAYDAPENIRAESFFSQDLARMNANLWNISWRMKVGAMSVGGAQVFKDLPPFETYEGTTGVGGLEVENAGIV